jgi:hypothetical protein
MFSETKRLQLVVRWGTCFTAGRYCVENDDTSVQYMMTCRLILMTQEAMFRATVSPAVRIHSNTILPAGVTAGA